MFNLYLIFFIVSVIITGIYFYRWQKRFNVYSVVFYTLIPITILGCWLRSTASNVEEAIAGNKVLYLSGYLSMFMMLCIFSACGIKINKKISFTLFIFTSVVYSSVLTIGWSDIFYKDTSIEIANGVTVLSDKEYGFMHGVFIAMVAAYFAATLIALAAALFRNRKIPRLYVSLLFGVNLCSLVGYFAGHSLGNDYFLNISYIMMQVVYLIIINRICLYDISDNAIEGLINDKRYAYISLDKKMRYLGCNRTAETILPGLKDFRLDSRIDDSELGALIIGWVDKFSEGSKEEIQYPYGDRIYKADISYLYDRGRKCGYQINLNDDTQDIKYIALLNDFNADLQSQVEAKTAHIEEMHNKLILGMAVMVESRDNSTGGHIRRTSDCIKILIGKIRETGCYQLDDVFCKNLIKAAPMHDLGKIAVDDKILRKPGRFEPEEFEIMKTHADKGAQIIWKILEGTDDNEFKKIAVNVAHYHHERYDGTGYPHGLKGEEIPLEARIMAIVDVYDALVSKRCYKDSMPFDKAFAIIDEGMGTQFDPKLRESFHAARAELERYYS